MRPKKNSQLIMECCNNNIQPKPDIDPDAARLCINWKCNSCLAVYSQMFEKINTQKAEEINPGKTGDSSL